jgi:hypothetical protein
MSIGIWRSCDRALWYILVIKPTIYINFSNLFFKWSSTCFGQFPCPSSRVLQCTYSKGTCHTVLLTACEQDVPVRSWSQAVSKSVWHVTLLYVQWRIPDDGQRNCPKHVELHFKSKFEKLVHLFGFIIRNPLAYFELETLLSNMGHNFNQYVVTWL